MDVRKIKLAHTEPEWQLLEQFAEEQGFSNFRSMFNNTMRKLNVTLKSEGDLLLPGCAECNSLRGNLYDVDVVLYQKIQELSKVYCMPVTSIIRYFTTDQALVVERLDKHF